MAESHTYRLDSIAPGLVDVIKALPPKDQRLVASNAAKFAMQQADTIGLVLGPDPHHPEKRQNAEGLVNEPDEAAFRASDRHSEASSEYKFGFKRARSVAAFALSLADDPREAALEGVYEAAIATEDLPAIAAIASPSEPLS